MSSLLDRMYARYSNRRLFFRQGWGDMGLLKGLSPDWLQERAQAKIKKKRQTALGSGRAGSQVPSRRKDFRRKAAPLTWR